jgi:uncharacterized protein RhaS with RHS repeats
MQYRHRYYDPMLGRFISRDPLEYGGGTTLSLFEYARSNPCLWSDPSGQTTDEYILCVIWAYLVYDTCIKLPGIPILHKALCQRIFLGMLVACNKYLDDDEQKQEACHRDDAPTYYSGRRATRRPSSLGEPDREGDTLR